ncbi:sterol desaturase family protein [Rhabdobacter roseus]|uniref:Sterol desaturase/sphingolipid hydroxylase (Fatty acid hydroxylase superfamily) n=1 Tax=Rhabdobacter roseus TaxID=1655419 RepID=A0A840TX75_9BACT|nr:sterol desaturase family protein [Rhabdobacter roseus]MBB5285863.1 sterol desaturase/sphingolipid hydroxylase (fatty acid hydroxylase superfamily) [Rhabdobacter roseus]
MDNPIVYAIPVFVLSIVVEVLYLRHLQRHQDHYQTKDTVSSLSMGIGNVVTGLVSKALVVGALVLVYNYRLFELNRAAWWYWVALFLADDFSYYWFHRTSHGVRYFWASHVVHHSSQYYNLGTALRQTWTGELSGSFIFYLWMPLVGFHPIDVVLMQAISLLYQFWIHTETIYKLPRPIEFIFNTPAHHRVHHGSDVKYLDKNHAGILIIWDRLFGTFQEEEERPRYGLTTNLGTYNPIRIALHEWVDISKDVARAPSLKVALGYLFGPPGWSHDGSRKTARQLQQEEEARKKHDLPGT